MKFNECRTPGASPRRATRALPFGFQVVPPSIALLFPPPKKRKRFSSPCPCRPSLAGDASEVL